MEKLLITKVKQMEGNLLGIGIDNYKIKDIIQSNEKIKNCYLLEEASSKLNKKNMNLFNRQKKINIKKIKKVFKKKRMDNTICNFKTIKPFLKTFIRDSIYINKNKIYIYGGNDDYESLIERYKRYTDKIEIKQEKDQVLIIIDTNNTSNNKIKDIIYWWKDSISNVIDVITMLLVN